MGKCCEDIPILGDIEDAVHDVADAVGDILTSVGDVVEDVVDGVGDVLEAVGDTISSVLENPKALVGVALSIAFPGAGAALGSALGLGTGVVAKIAGQALINATINGGDVKAAVIGAVLPVAGQEVANTLSATLASSGITGTVNSIITRAATQAATAEILGKDPVTAFVMGGVSAGVGAITADIPGFKDLPAPAQNALSAAIGTKLVNGNTQNAIIDSLVDDSIQWAKGQVNKAPAAIKAAQEKYKSTFGKDIPNAQLEKAVETGGFEFLVASTDSLADILGTLDDAQKAKAISKVESSALEFEDAVNYTPKKWLEELSLGELPTVEIKADRDKGWKHTTDDNGYTVMWNDSKGLIQLYDENDQLLKSLTGQFKKDKDGNVVGRNLDYYLTVAQDSFWRSGQQTASLIADVLPAMAAKAVGNQDYFKKQMAEAQAVMERVKRDYPSRVPSYKDVNDLGSAATYVLESVMEGVVTTAPTLLMGGAAGVAARASAKAAMDSAIKKELAEQAAKGVFGAEAIAAAQSAASRAGLAVAAKYTTPAILAGSASQNIPEVFKNVYDAKSGKVDLKDLAISTVVGSFNAALDAVLPSAIVDRLNLSKIPVDEVIGAWYKNAAKEGGAAFLKEGGTEVLQEMSSAAAESFLAQNKEFFTQQNLDRFINAGLKGGIGGSTISTTFALGKDAAGALSSQEIISQGLDRTTPAEYLAASQMFKDAGFNASTKDIAAITGAAPEALGPDLQAALNSYIDPRVVSDEEARQELLNLGYTDPTQDEVNAFIGQRDEASTLAALKEQYNPLATTAEEAQQMMRDLGYTNLTDSEAQSLAGKIKEEDARKNIETYVDPRMVSREEAEQFFRSIGYNPTKEEIDQFVRQGAGVDQTAVQTEVGAYADPRMVDEQEARDAYAALGLKKPTQEDVLKLVGQYDQAGLSEKATENLDAARYNSIISQLDSLSVGASKETLDAIALVKSDLNSQIAALGGDVAKLQSGVDSIVASQDETKTQIQNLQTNLSAEIQAAKDIGLKGDEALQAGLDSLSTKMGIDQAALLSQMGTTAADLKAKFAADIAASQAATTTEIANTRSALEAAVANAKAAGLEGDAALKSAIDVVAADQRTSAADLLTKLGTTEEALRTELTTGQKQTQQQIADIGIEVDARINELMQQGQTYQQATQQAFAEVNAKNQELSGLIGTQGRAADQSDIDALSQMLGGQRDVDLAYDVTGDKQITQADIDFLTGVVGGKNTDWTAPQQSPWAATGLYGQIQANELIRQKDLADAEARRLADQEAAAEATRKAEIRSNIRTTTAQGQQQLRDIQQQLPQALQQAQEVSTPIYGQMGPYLDVGSDLDFGFFKPSPEKLAGTKQQQPTKIAAGGYIDDLLAGDMTADDLLNLLR